MPKFKEKLTESMAAVLPITGIVLMLSVFLIPLELGTVVMFFVGAALLIVGMALFQLGVEMAMTPFGEGIGKHLSRSKTVWIIALISFLMGVIITVAEPDLQVLSNQVPSIPNAVIIWTVALGVGLFLMLAVVRIVFKINLSMILMILYGVVLLLSFFIPKEFLAVAFDSGGVTTGPVTVPFIMAMGVGISAIRADKNASSDSFGLVALSSVGPILAVMLLGCFYNPSAAAAAVSAPEVIPVGTMQEVAYTFAVEIPHYLKEVAVSILPLVAMFALFQLISHRYQHRQKLRILVGFGYTYAGLVLFLCGVNVGFAPAGTLLGFDLASPGLEWLLIPIGMLIGYFIVKAEPAIQILNQQVQTVTNGTISAKSMNLCLSVGVAVSVGLAMARIIFRIPLFWIVLPGYIIALVMTRFVPKIFIGIAFDSGGVASGPMTSTFLLPLCIGACERIGGNIMTDAFGVVALVALTPLIAIQIMGIRYQLKLTKAPAHALPDDSDDIIEIEED